MEKTKVPLLFSINVQFDDGSEIQLEGQNAKKMWLDSGLSYGSLCDALKVYRFERVPTIDVGTGLAVSHFTTKVTRLPHPDYYREKTPNNRQSN